MITYDPTLLVEVSDDVSGRVRVRDGVVAETSTEQKGLSRMISAILLVLSSVVIARYAWRDIVQVGVTDPESSHVLLVPVVFLWIAWHRRRRLQWSEPQDRWLGTLFVVCGVSLWWIGDRFQFEVFWHSGAILMAVGAFLTVAGANPFWSLLPAFGSLVFLVPAPSLARAWLALPLQRMTAIATQVAAELIGMNIERTGSLLRINGVDVAIAEACNGMRLAFTLLLACYLFVFVTPLRWPIRLIIIMLSPIVAVAANVARLVPTVWAYGNGSRESAARFHDISGWAMLVVAFVGLMGVVRLLQWIGVSVEPADPRLRVS